MFKLTPPAIPGQQWTETVLYSCTPSPDGAVPEAGVIFDSIGALYGTTAFGGGPAANGTVFKLTP